jgi:hypothetical protein
MSSFDARKLTLAATVLCAGVLALSRVERAQSSGLPPTAARRPVALVLAIAQGYYREYLNDEPCTAHCLTLQTSIAAGVRDTLKAKFPFLEWNGVDAVDTIVLTWQNDALGARSSQILFELRGPGTPDSSWFPVAFETRDDFRNREEDDWTPERLRVAWLARLPKALGHKDLLPRVVGRVSLSATVKPFAENEKRLLIDANPDSIFAQENEPPAFDVPVHVVYARDGIDEDARVPLINCNEFGKKGYSCLVEEMRFARNTRRELALDSVLQFGRLNWKNPRVTRFVPRPLIARTGRALVTP